MSTVLVTGATGFVGGAVARALLAAGHRVVAWVRSPAKARALAGQGARVAAGDMRDPATYLPLVDEVDAVVHAAQLRVTGRLGPGKIRLLHQANHVMTDALARRCMSAGKRLLYTGGCFVYGDHGDDWIDESTPLTPSPLGEGDANEIARLRDRHEAGLDVVVLSPGFVYGPGGNFTTLFYDDARRGRLRCIGRGRNYWSCVHVDDLAEAYVLALTRAPAGATYNIVDDEPLRLREFVDLLADAVGGVAVRPVPAFLARLVAGAPAVTSLTSSYRVNNTKARRDLGWAPSYPTARDGIPPTLSALKRLESAASTAS